MDYLNTLTDSKLNDLTPVNFNEDTAESKRITILNNCRAAGSLLQIMSSKMQKELRRQSALKKISKAGTLLTQEEYDRYLHQLYQTLRSMKSKITQAEEIRIKVYESYFNVFDASENIVRTFTSALNVFLLMACGGQRPSTMSNIPDQPMDSFTRLIAGPEKRERVTPYVVVPQFAADLLKFYYNHVRPVVFSRLPQNAVQNPPLIVHTRTGADIRIKSLRKSSIFWSRQFVPGKGDDFSTAVASCVRHKSFQALGHWKAFGWHEP